MNKTLAILAAGLWLALAGAAAAEDAAGDWLGVLNSLHVGVRIRKAADGGGYQGSFDSLDQGMRGMALGDIRAGGDSLAFTVTQANLHFEGKWDAGQKAWVGSVTGRGAPLPLTLTRGVIPPAPTVQGLDGDWDGTLDVNGQKLRLALHVSTTADGTVASFDSIDQQAMGIPVAAVSRTGDQVDLQIKAIQGDYKGTLAGDGKTIAGTWSQAGLSWPLTMTRRAAGAPQATLSRPQTPKPPFPYLSEDLTFDDSTAKVKLAGTLTIPKAPGRYPAVVLVSGSGPNTRDEPILGHRLFAVIADHLTRKGIAVLRYDKRGTGASTGDYGKATTLDFADDVDAAVAYLRSRKDIDPGRIGLIGHSEGGLIAPIVAARNPKVGFIVMMAGPGVNGVDILTEQGRLLTKAAGASDEQVTTSQALRTELFHIVNTEKDPAVVGAKSRQLLLDYMKAQGLPPAVAEQMAKAQADQLNTDWFRFFFTYDPAPTLRKLRIPVLALIGSNDLQVPAAQNLGPLRAALAEDRNAEVRELPGLNHLFQTAKTGGLAEYAQIEETIAPSALEFISSWILRQIGKP